MFGSPGVMPSLHTSTRNSRYSLQIHHLRCEGWDRGGLNECGERIPNLPSCRHPWLHLVGYKKLQVFASCTPLALRRLGSLRTKWGLTLEKCPCRLVPSVILTHLQAGIYQCSCVAPQTSVSSRNDNCQFLALVNCSQVRFLTC
jgi:hypothetical protein